MTDDGDSCGHDPFAAIAKPKCGRPPKQPRVSVKATPLAKDSEDPFTTPPDRCHVSVLSNSNETLEARSRSRPKLSLVHGAAGKPVAPPAVDDADPFGPSDPAELAPPPSLPDDRRCGLDDPFGPALQLPFVAVGRDWDGCLRLHALGVDGPIEQRSLRTTHEDAAFKEAERVAIKLNAMLVGGVQSGLTIIAIESAIKATVAAMKVGA